MPKATRTPAVAVEEVPADMPEDMKKAEKERGIEGQWLTDMGRFFDAFPDRALSHDIFTVVEDSRLDARLLHEYRGIAAAYHVIQEHSLAERPAIDELPMREAMIEFIVRISLRQRSGLKVPRDYKKVARQIAHLVDSVATHEALREDSAEANLGI